MARVYLDANAVFDLVVRKPSSGDSLVHNSLYYSPLTAHILFYSHHIKIPSPGVNKALKKIHVVNLTRSILNKALLEPTSDLEDNIQLHSAAEAECDFFLTNDKKLLKMKFFGKVKIQSHLKTDSPIT